MTHRLAVLISGAGSNLQALIDAIAAGTLPAEIAVVISNVSTAAGLARAIRAGLPTITLDHRAYPNRDAFDQALSAELDRINPDTIVLAGFMRILGDELVKHFRGKLINIHPSLLPRYPGLHTHRRALEAGDPEHGCSVHFVTEELDGGPLIARARLCIHADDDASSLAARVQQLEHSLYPQVLAWRAAGRLHLDGNQARLDGSTITLEE